MKRTFGQALGFLAIALFVAVPVRAHCDTLDGPVVVDARSALETGDVTPVLKWVGSRDEAEIRAAFSKTLAARKGSPEAKDLADFWFLETLVRVHRAGEGAPYTGLKPAGSEIDPAVKAADAALASGSVDALVALVTEAAASGIRERFREAVESKKHAGHNVEAGRAFVAAYVDYVHYAEGLYGAATPAPGHAHHEHSE